MNVLEKFKLKNLVAVVTGAGKGIGRGIAISLAEAGAEVTKIEPVGGDWSKELSPQTKHGVSALYQSFNRNKTIKEVDIQSENGVFKKLTQPVKTVELRDIGDHPDFDFDPFYITTQSGIQTLDLRELSE